MNILVVDDHRDTADAIEVLLGFRGHHVRTAYSGVEAVALARDFSPELAFVDLELGDLRGGEVAQALRAYGARFMRLVALSGRALRATDLGFDLHLLKPVSARQLYACCDGACLALPSGHPRFTTS